MQKCILVQTSILLGLILMLAKMKESPVYLCILPTAVAVGRFGSFTTFSYGSSVINIEEDGGFYVGVCGHCNNLNPKGKKFSCKHGQRI